MSFSAFKKLSNGPVVFDGAMGTLLVDKLGKNFCNVELNLSKPDVISSIHRDYAKAGSDVIIANTFSANEISLSDHDLKDKFDDINRAAIRIAKGVSREFTTKKVLVAGELGPTSKLPSLSHVSFDDLFSTYKKQVSIFVSEGVDFIVFSTFQDPLQLKAALAATRESSTGLPVFASVTLEKQGTMLLGTDLAAALAVVSPYKPFAFGLNCATGPKLMEEHLDYLSTSSPYAVMCRPNAGMPNIVNGKAKYEMDPKEFAGTLGEFASRFKIAFVGGCCGTTPDHIAKLNEYLKEHSYTPYTGGKKFGNFASSLYSAVSFEQEPRPFLIAEQTNVNGSKAFRQLIEKNDFEAMADAAKLASKGSHALDVCLALPGRNEKDDFLNFLKAVALKVDSPLMIDSTNPDVIEEALKHIPGRALVNSINFEDGGDKARKVIKHAKRFGAALVGLCIDETGMAKTCEQKLKIAKRIYDIFIGEGLDAGDLFIDALTFTIASGDKNEGFAASETLKAISEIKRTLPGVRTVLGVSNVSYGLSPKARKYLTSVFLARALAAGLDAAIINSARVMPVDKIDKDIRSICDRLIDGSNEPGDLLKELIAKVDLLEGAKSEATYVSSQSSRPEDVLRQKIIDGSRDGLENVIEELVAKIKPGEVINRILMPAMQDVGGRFGKGTMPLPFVLESAETMRAAIDIVTTYMKGEKPETYATIVLATVRGDVHDIGKNLVDAILSNNGFKVVNLGTKQPAQAIIDAVRSYKADAIGLSGLLTTSVQIMKEDLLQFRNNGIDVPVLCGGAVLTESYTRTELSPAYGSKVYYCSDAFDGFVAMQEVAKMKKK